MSTIFLAPTAETRTQQFPNTNLTADREGVAIHGISASVSRRHYRRRLMSGGRPANAVIRHLKGQPSRGGDPLWWADYQRKGTSMAKQRVTKSLAAAAAIMGFFAVHAATAQQTPSLPLPAGSTAHFVYFATGGYALTPEDQDHIRDVAGMMQSTPAFVATIIGKTDSVGSAEFNEHLAQRRAEAVFEALVYTYKVPENRVRLHWTGERLPYISTADEQAEAQNRMVAIIVSNDPSRGQ